MDFTVSPSIHILPVDGIRMSLSYLILAFVLKLDPGPNSKVCGGAVWSTKRDHIFGHDEV